MPLIEAATTGWPESCVVSATASGRIATSLPQWAPNRREGSRAEEPLFIDEARERTSPGGAAGALEILASALSEVMRVAQLCALSVATLLQRAISSK